MPRFGGEESGRSRVSAMQIAMQQKWLITEHGLKSLLAIASRKEVFSAELAKALEARGGEKLDNSHAVSRRNGVATIPVAGPLFRHASLFTEISGATSYDTIARDLQLAIDDPSVTAIVLEIDSPGGEANGVGELAGMIRASSKPIKAYVGGMACSAAYWLASACNEIVASESSELGSIGCVFAYLDDRAALEADGYKEVKFISSSSPLKQADPMTDAGKGQYQQWVDDLAAVFIENVATNRGVSVEHVKENYGRGGFMVGARALAAGLADRLGTYEGLLAELAPQPTTTQSKGRTYMTKEMQAKINASLGLAGDASEDEMYGAIVSAAESHRSLPALREELGKAKAVACKASLRAALERGIASGKLTLGQIQTTIPLFIADEAKGAEMVAAFGKLTAVTKESVVDTACSFDVDEKAINRINAYAASNRSIARAEDAPPRDDKADATELEKDAKVEEESAKRVKAGADAQRARDKKESERRQKRDGASAK